MDGPLKILLIEGTRPGAGRLTSLLAEAGQDDVTVSCAPNLQAGLDRLTGELPHVVLLDGEQDPPGGEETFRLCQARSPLIPIVLLVSAGQEEVGLAAVEGGAQDYLVRQQVSGPELVRSLRGASVRAARLRRQLRASESAFRALFDCAAVGVSLVDTQGSILLSNPALATLLDCPARELRGMTFAQWVAGDDQRRRHETALAEFTAGRRERFQQELPLARRDGRPAWGRASASFVHPGGEGSGYVILMVEDITERKAAEAQLHLQADILQNMSDWVTATDRQGRITYVSRSVEQVLGIRPEELIGRSMHEVYPVPGGNEAPPTLDDLTRSDAPALRGEQTFVRSDGGTIVVSLHTSTLRNADGEVMGLLSVARDITQRKQAERALASANEQLTEQNATLEQMNATAGRFVDNVAHEFRTPLTVVQEFTSIIADGIGGPVTADQAEYLGIIGSAAGDLTRLVDDLLDSSKLKAGTLRVDRRSHSVSDIVEGIWPMIRSKADTKGIELICRIDPDVPEVLADREKVGRILINLAVNAVKFSPEGSTVTVWARPAETGGVRVGVTDQGPGMSDEESAVIFERFTQVGDVMAASAKGFGLGLNIARELAWLNLATIEVDSRVGEGTTFSVQLPRAEGSCILRQYAAHISRPPHPAGSLLVLRVSAEDPAWGGDALQRLVVCGCGPLDLVLPSSNGGLTVLAPDADPDVKARRIRDACLRAAQGQWAAPSELRIETVANSPWPGDGERALADISPLVLPEALQA